MIKNPKLLKETSRIETDTMGRIANAVRKSNLPRHSLTPQLEKLNKEYFDKVRALVSSMEQRTESDV